MATPLGGNVGAIASDVELTADFTSSELTGKFDRFSILLEAATGDGWQRIPASIEVAGRILNDGFMLTDTGFSQEDGVLGSGQLDSGFVWPGLMWSPAETTNWRVKRNQVLGLTPELPDLPEFSVKAHFAKDAEEVIGTVETISPLAVERGDSTGILSLSMSFGADTATMPAPGPTSATTLARLIPDPANTFEAVSRSLHHDYEVGRASVTDRFAIESVGSDGDGGFYVTYVVDGAKATVHFSKEDYGTEDLCCYTKEIDGESYWLWSEAGDFDGTNYGIVDRNFSYFDPLASSYAGGGRTRLIYGVPTGPDDMPAGIATYNGWMYAEAFNNTLGDISTSAARSKVRGGLVLTADFADAAFEGRIFGLSIQGPGVDYADREILPSSTEFEISDGQIVDGKFTATLTGVDDDTNADLSNSVRGYAGDVSGRFYGPSAREFGAVVTANRSTDDTDDWAMLGYLGGTKERDIVIDSSSQFSSLVNRDYGSSQTSIGTSDSAKVEPTTSGYRMTFTIDGAQKAIDVTEADLGGITGNTYDFQKIVQTASVSRSFYLWRWQGNFPNSPEYDYLDVNGVILADYTPGVAQETANLNDVSSGYVVRGTRTLTSDMPTAPASYTGRMQAREWPTDVLSTYTDVDEYRGDFSMTADFAAGTVTGTVSNVVSRPSFSGTDTSSPSTGLTFQGTVSGNSITANSLSGTGSFAGYR
ncbi:MAG: transferrin-binding protein-like solute binding protein, partial [Rhodospirillaceae bacterium]|nr:transferrin-binding protein-like solute binding protein [Rhodospirillaceae bacterium]